VADPQLQIEQRLDRIEQAISTMAQWLVDAQTGFGVKDAEGIEKILRGEKNASPEE
jgi:predicted transcriptional regulator